MYQDVNQSFLDQAHSWRWWHEGVNVLTDVDEVNTVSQQADHYQQEFLFLSNVHSLRNGYKLRDTEILTSINSDHVMKINTNIYNMINCCVLKYLKLTFKWIMDIPLNCLSIAVIDILHNILHTILLVIDILHTIDILLVYP